MPTLFEKLTAAGLPIKSASDEEGVHLIAGAELTPAQSELMGELILQHQNPADYQIYLNSKTDRQQLKAEYQNTIDTLIQIENATSPTNAQVIAGVKFIAKTLRLLLKLLARQYQ